MANKIVKIVYDANTWIDMTGDTAVPANVLTNKTFHTSTGQETGSMPNGTAGTPVATKGTVSNNSIAVTPSVTNTTGYIVGGTKTGTAVTVSASELVSGTKTITSSGTTDVTNYANASIAAGSATTPTTTITANPVVTVNYSTGSISVSVDADKSITPTVSAGYISSGTAGTVSVNGNYTGQLFTIYDGSHHSAGYPVTISLTNPHDDYAFGSVDIYQLDYNNAQISTWADNAIFLGSIESSTGSITVTVSIDAFERNCIKAAIITQGMDYDIDSSTATGGVTYLFDYDGPTFEVAESGTVTIDGIWWDED